MLTGRALRRRAAIAAAVPPVLRLHETRTATVAALATQIQQPPRLVAEACKALEREGWVTVNRDRVELTAMATRTMDDWETEMTAALQ